MTTVELRKGAARIVVVDDEPSVTRFVGRLLEIHGYEPLVFTSPRHALTEFMTRPDYADLIVTDQTMPDLTGIELIEHIRARNSKIPVLLFTGFSGVISEDSVKPWGPSAFMTKPLDSSAFLREIDRLLSGRSSRKTGTV